MEKKLYYNLFCMEFISRIFFSHAAILKYFSKIDYLSEIFNLILKQCFGLDFLQEKVCFVFVKEYALYGSVMLRTLRNQPVRDTYAAFHFVSLAGKKFQTVKLGFSSRILHAGNVISSRYIRMSRVL